MPIDKSLISGSTSMLLLKLLTEKDMYGYEMIETLRKKSNDVFELKAGTLYPLLHSLEQKGYLTSYEEEASGKVRKYYSITGEGKRYLKGKRRGMGAIRRSGIRSTGTALHKSLRYSTRYLRQEHAREARRRVRYAVASRTHT